MRIHLRSGLIALTLALPAATATAQRDHQTSESKWGDQIAAGRWVRVSNTNGKIIVGQSTTGRVEVTAAKNWRRGNPDDVKIVTRKDGEDIEICALWNNQTDCGDTRTSRRRGWNDWNDNSDDVWVDFTVLIPKGTKVRSVSVNGGTTITGATAEVDAQTVNGEVRVEASGGPIRAEGVNGRVYARITGPATGSMDFSTTNGSVILELPEELGADITMSTVNGSLDSDFPLTVRGRIDRRNMSAHIGNGTGGPKITLSTVNGSVELRKR